MPARSLEITNMNSSLTLQTAFGAKGNDQYSAYAWIDSLPLSGNFQSFDTDMSLTKDMAHRCDKITNRLVVLLPLWEAVLRMSGGGKELGGAKERFGMNPGDSFRTRVVR